MICGLTNVSDVALLVGFDSGRVQLLCPGEKTLYNDSFEITTNHTWDLVIWGFIKDEDEIVDLKVHNWISEGF